jgi:hypothetical protein
MTFTPFHYLFFPFLKSLPVLTVDLGLFLPTGLGAFITPPAFVANLLSFAIVSSFLPLSEKQKSHIYPLLGKHGSVSLDSGTIYSVLTSHKALQRLHLKVSPSILLPGSIPILGTFSPQPGHKIFVFCDATAGVIFSIM